MIFRNRIEKLIIDIEGHETVFVSSLRVRGTTMKQPQPAGQARRSQSCLIFNSELRSPRFARDDEQGSFPHWKNHIII